MEEMAQLLGDPRVSLVQVHQCLFGRTAPIEPRSSTRAPSKKATGFLTNGWCIASELGGRCGGVMNMLGWLKEELLKLRCILFNFAKQYAVGCRLISIMIVDVNQCTYVPGRNKTARIDKHGGVHEVNLLRRLPRSTWTRRVYSRWKSAEGCF